jgi:hypothetical protein
MPKTYFEGYDEAHKTENVCIKGLFLNGKRITALSKENFHIGKFAESITIE